MATPSVPAKQPTASKDEYKPATLLVPAERHISVAFSEIFSIAKTTMNVAQRQRYEEVCQLLESLYQQEFMNLRRSLKHNFLPFSTGAKEQQLTTRKGRPLPPKADLDLKEVKLVADFLQLMASARFNLMTKEEWDIATSEKFMFYLPVEVNWDYFDDKLLPAFWDSDAERRAVRKRLPECADRVLVLHRGIGLAEDSGRYINQKVDLLVQYLLVDTFWKVWAWLLTLLASLKQKIWPNKQLPATSSSSSRAYGRLQSAGPSAAQEEAERDQAMEQTFTEDLVVPEGHETHRAARVVERRTLQRLLPTAGSVIKNLTTVMHLQEPMYKEVVVLYRTSGQGRVSARSKVPVRSRSTEERLKDILARRNIHIKCFHDIPLADMEVIFPDKKVFLKTLSLINLVVQACTTFFATMTGLWRLDALDLKAAGSALSVVAARAGTLYSSMQAERSHMIQDMVNILYDKTNDAQEGVLSMLLEDMAEQQLKEAVLAYTMLYLNMDDELSEEEVDDLCERFLEDNFDLRLDFAVEDALPQLEEWNMIRYNPAKDRYQALPLEVALKSLSEHWQRCYESLSKPPVKKELPLTALLPHGSRKAYGARHSGHHLMADVAAGMEKRRGSTLRRLFKRNKADKHSAA